MQRVAKIFFFLGVVFFLGYLLLPAPGFPQPPPGALQSMEPADLESPLRRGYYTNYTREEIIGYYQNQLERSFFSIHLPAYRLNYPPEDAQVLIRDQTQSTYLEEIVYPFRESMFINGFEPVDPQYAVNYRGVSYRQKVTVKYIPSSVWVRVPMASLALVVFFVLARAFPRDIALLVRDWFGKSV